MFCKQCGIQVDNQDQFCNNCGAQIEIPSQSSFAANPKSSRIVIKIDILAIIGGISLIVAFFLPWFDRRWDDHPGLLSCAQMIVTIIEQFISNRQNNFALGMQEIQALFFVFSSIMSLLGSGLIICLAFMKRKTRTRATLTCLSSILVLVCLIAMKELAYTTIWERGFLLSILVGVVCLIVSIISRRKIEAPRSNQLRVLALAILFIIVLATGIYGWRYLGNNKVYNNLRSSGGPSISQRVTDFLSSCLSNPFSNDLSRSTAKNKLPKIVNVITRDLNHKYGNIAAILCDSNGQIPADQLQQFEETDRLLNSLRNAGYITYDKNIQYGQFGFTTTAYVRYSVSFKDTLRPFIVKNNDYGVTVAIATEVVDDVTGITKAPMDETARIVNFSTRIETNKLSEALPLNNSERTLQERSAYFRKYDDGWRLDG
jgi:hypothetical protein